MLGIILLIIIVFFWIKVMDAILDSHLFSDLITFLQMLFSIILAAFFAIIVGVNTFQPFEPDKEEFSHEVYSIDFSDNSEGSFMLGSGSIRGERRFFVYYKTGESDYKIESYLSDEVTIRESIDPPAVIERTCSKRSKWKLLLNFRSCDDSQVILRIPKGHIVQHYTVN